MTTPTNTIPVESPLEKPWVLPSRGIVGMVVPHLSPKPRSSSSSSSRISTTSARASADRRPPQVLELPILGTICLLSSSFTVHWAVSALRKEQYSRLHAWLGDHGSAGAIFLLTTAREWYHLIYDYGLTIRTNLFGTTFYSLVGLHATHVIVGLIMLTLALVFSLRGHVTEKHEERLEVLSLYWHFVDAVWVVVFIVVYVLGR